MNNNHRSTNGYLWRRALAVSASVSLAITVLILFFGLLSPAATPRKEADLGGHAEPFSPIARQDLEAVYRDAWVAVKDNYIDAGKLSQWQRWEHAFDGRIRTEEQLVAAIRAMLASLDDPYTVYISAADLRRFEQETSGKFVGIGIGVNDSYGIVNVMPDTPAQKAGLAQGDVISAVDGTPVGGLTTQELVALIRGEAEENSQVVLTVVRQNQFVQVPVVRQIIKREPAVRTYRAGDTRVGNSIRIDNLRSETIIKDLEGAIEAMNRDKIEGLVIDLRGVQGGSGLTAAQVAAMFLSEGIVAHSAERADGETLTNTFEVRDGKLFHLRVHPRVRSTPSAIDTPVHLFKGTVVVLVDDRTSGAAEIIASALQANGRAAVVGIKTAGKGSGQCTVLLDDEHALRITASDYLTPAQTRIQGSGVTPDLAVPEKEKGSIFAKGMQELEKRLPEPAAAKD